MTLFDCWAMWDKIRYGIAVVLWAMGMVGTISAMVGSARAGLFFTRMHMTGLLESFGVVAWVWGAAWAAPSLREAVIFGSLAMALWYVLPAATHGLGKLLIYDAQSTHAHLLSPKAQRPFSEQSAWTSTLARPRADWFPRLRRPGVSKEKGEAS
jgi:multisubunit Na+/H+ antiporter MnhG subunit